MSGFPVSVKGVVIRGGRVVLLRNEREEWELPGGRLEPGESPEECLRREVWEELGLSVGVAALLHAWTYPVQKKREVFVVSYGCYDGGGEISRSAEHTDCGWFELGELTELALPEGYRKAVRLWTGFCG